MISWRSTLFLMLEIRTTFETPVLNIICISALFIPVKLSFMLMWLFCYGKDRSLPYVNVKALQAKNICLFFAVVIYCVYVTAALFCSLLTSAYQCCSSAVFWDSNIAILRLKYLGLNVSHLISNCVVAWSSLTTSKGRGFLL